jgi:Ca2+-binding RTX toxin-like protein
LQGSFGTTGTQVQLGINNYTTNGNNGSSAGYETYTVLAGNASTQSNQNTMLVGSTTNDTLTGGAGNDWLEAGSGSDTLFSSGGYDRLSGGLGFDTVNYGAFDNLSAGVKGIMVKAVDLGNAASINNYLVFKGQNYELHKL